MAEDHGKVGHKVAEVAHKAAVGVGHILHEAGHLVKEAVTMGTTEEVHPHKHPKALDAVGNLVKGAVSYNDAIVDAAPIIPEGAPTYVHEHRSAAEGIKEAAKVVGKVVVGALNFNDNDAAREYAASHPDPPAKEPAHEGHAEAHKHGVAHKAVDALKGVGHFIGDAMTMRADAPFREENQKHPKEQQH